jgi:uncharacterized DUF497 family protein
VSFEEAQELLLSGRDYYEVFDRTHSQDEDRFIAVRPTRRGMLTVVWTEREEHAVRIISARAATRSERSLYLAYMEGHG